MKRSSLSERHCAIARGGAELIDAWTFMILRELFLGNNRFDGLQKQTGMSPRSLTIRLKHLVEADILEKVAYQQAPARHDYRLTNKGIELWPVVTALKQWGDEWHGPWGKEGPPVQLIHKGEDHPLKIRMVCDTCGQAVSAHDSQAICTAGFESERSIRRA
jgi:DNA-binding HxlR family transcriptional regulator